MKQKANSKEKEIFFKELTKLIQQELAVNKTKAELHYIYQNNPQIRKLIKNMKITAKNEKSHKNEV